jgi:DNA-binding Lrp family transcriptional regulator
MAERLGIPEQAFLDAATHLKTQGYMRRMAAVLRHREAGFRANAMGVWVVPPDRAEGVGAVMASFAAVSHCYLRPAYPDWPYNVFTMVHGQTPADCQAAIDAMSQATGIDEYALLYSTVEYKKTRLRYFTPDIGAWEAQARQAASTAVGA